VLVIARRRGERLLIGDVELVVLETRRGSVRLGLRAPLGTRIVRFELIADVGAELPPRPRFNARRR
jgi:carbon storage regulator CsrA